MLSNKWARFRCYIQVAGPVTLGKLIRNQSKTHLLCCLQKMCWDSGIQLNHDSPSYIYEISFLSLRFPHIPHLHADCSIHLFVLMSLTLGVEMLVKGKRLNFIKIVSLTEKMWKEIQCVSSILHKMEWVSEWCKPYVCITMCKEYRTKGRRWRVEIKNFAWKGEVETRISHLKETYFFLPLQSGKKMNSNPNPRVLLSVGHKAQESKVSCC